MSRVKRDLSSIFEWLNNTLEDDSIASLTYFIFIAISIGYFPVNFSKDLIIIFAAKIIIGILICTAFKLTIAVINDILLGYENSNELENNNTENKNINDNKGIMTTYVWNSTTWEWEEKKK